MDIDNATFFTNLFWIFFAIICSPIVLGWILRAIAGKHAPAYYEPETEDERTARKRKAAKKREEYNLYYY